MAVGACHTSHPVHIRGHIVPLQTIGPLNVITLNQGYAKVIFIIHLEPSIIIPTNEISIVAGKTPNIRDLSEKPVVQGPFGLDVQMTCGTAGIAGSAGIIIALVINVTTKASPPEHIRNKSPFCTRRFFYG